MTLALVIGGVIVLIRNGGNLYLVVPVISKKDNKTAIEANELLYQIMIKESILRKIGNFREVGEEAARVIYYLLWPGYLQTTGWK